MSERLFTVGKIVNTHGIKGEVKIISNTDFPEERYRKGSQLILTHPVLPASKKLTIETVRYHKNAYIVKFKEFHMISDVEGFKNGMLKITEEQRLELEEDEFYYDEIIGCETVTEQGELIGTITDIITTGANDVWVVKPNEGKDILLPYIDDCILKVDIQERKIVVHLMEGLI